MSAVECPVIVLVDGDIVTYRAGFAAEKRRYYLTGYPPGTTGHIYWTSAKAAREHCELTGLDYKKDISWVRVAEPLVNALHNVHSLIDKDSKLIQRKMDALYKEGVIGFEPSGLEVFVFLSGCTEVPNFRDKIFPMYKGSRDPEQKPTHMEEIREYIQANYNTIVSEGCEADDMFGQAIKDATAKFPNSETVIYTADKDLRQIPGFHFDITEKELNLVTESEGLLWFFKQMLIGDRVDNIEGIYGIGEVKASKLLSGKTIPQMWDEVQRQYKRAYGPKWEEKYDINCDLLWIWRKIPDECPYKTTSDLAPWEGTVSL